MKFRDYTLSLGSSRIENTSSFYTPTTIYDMETMSSNFSVNLDKILWRNQKSKLRFKLYFLNSAFGVLEAPRALKPLS